MAAATVLPSRNAITSEDWYREQMPTRPIGDPHAEFQEQGLSTGVRVTDDGRLDIKFWEQRPWLGALKKLIEEHPTAIREEQAYPTISPAEEEKFPLRLNIVIQVVGSRGDIQPFIVIGKELKRHGHRVRLATHLPFRDEIKKAGLEFFNIGGDPAALMAFMVKNPGLMPDFNTITSGALLKRRQEMKTIFTGCWRACYEPGDGTNLHQLPDDLETNAVDNCNTHPFVADAIIANPPGFVHLSCAERLGIPLNMMFTMPWSPTQAFPHPLANVRSQNTKPSVANFASYAVTEVMMWEGLGDLINNFRKRELGLDPLDAIRAPSLVHRLRIPYTYLWSPSLLPKPDDWSDNIDVCGFQFLSSGSDYKPPDDLAAFLKAGEPPIYIGFGSIVVDNADKLTDILFEAVRLTGKRALISKGWGNFGKAAEVPEKIFLMGSCPHDWLFKHVCCVVHHGGAGTTAAGLLLGRPTVIVPFFGDQPFWGSIVARAGAGPQPVPYKQLTAEKLADAINKALHPIIQEKASEIGKRMQKENGVQNAVRSFHHHLDVESLRCSICPGRPAVWWIRHSHIKLSAFAMSILVQTGHIKARDIVLYRPQEYDTNRDPRGPISATAEVLYGVVTNFVSGIVDAPTQVAHMFSEVIPKDQRHNFSREWAMAHFAECLSKQEEKGIGQHHIHHHHHHHTHRVENEGSEDESEEEYQDQHQENGNGRFPSRTEMPVRCESVAAATPETLAEEFNLEKTLTGRFIRKRSTAQEILTETGNKASRFLKHLLECVILLPTDLTLSLSKGCHNAPKLYHDNTVQKIPKVMGINSGFRAAGTEFIQGFYYGITGLLVQPAQGFQEAGGKGLIQGVGKGIGGVFLKPAAGLCGLAGFPLDGLHKTLRQSLSRSKAKDIVRSRITQGITEMCAATPEERAMVIRTWHELRKVHTQGRHKDGRKHDA